MVSTTDLIAEARVWPRKLSGLPTIELMNALADALEAATKGAETLHFEWGTVYEVNSSTTEYEAWSNRQEAEYYVDQSPTDTGLVRRTVSDWQPVGGTE